MDSNEYFQKNLTKKYSSLEKNFFIFLKKYKEKMPKPLSRGTAGNFSKSQYRRGYFFIFPD